MLDRLSAATEQITGIGTSVLQVHILGPPRVEWAGRPLSLPRRQLRALLYLLATQLQSVPREQLCFLFWPDLPDAVARRHLSHLLTHVRRALPNAQLLRIDKDAVSLDPALTWSDAAAFERLRTVGTPDALQQAVDLYRGPFLSGFSLGSSPEFESWAVSERQALEHRYLVALATLLEERMAHGEHQAAIAFAQRYLATDNLAEDVHRRLIELYTLSGDRSAALRQYERCAVILERELGISPLPETRAAYQAALHGYPPQPPSPQTRLPHSLLPERQVPFVGRQDIFRRLEQVWSQAQRGLAQIVLIGGEAGIGKSRLMEEFIDRHRDKALVLVGGCHPATRSLPYQPLVEALRPVVSPGEGDQKSAWRLPPAGAALRSLSPVWLAEAVRLLPELRRLVPDLPPPLPADPEEARGRLFEALARLVLVLAAGPDPVVLILDDLHWADRTTLDWLGFFACHVRHSHRFDLEAPRLLVLGAYRSEAGEALTELRHSLSGAGTVVELQLSGLNAPAVYQLLEHLVPPSPGTSTPDYVWLAGRLQAATGGNPFFLLEIIRSFLETGRPAEDLADLGRFPVPDTVRLAVERRLQRLSARARQVLEAGAVLGNRFDLGLVRLTAGRGELETLAGLEELVTRQFLEEFEDGFSFRHELICRAVADGLAPVRRQLLHRRAGRALEQLQPKVVGALAHHFESGGDPHRALYYHRLAAQQAEAMFAWQETEEHQSRMLALLSHIDPACIQPECQAQRAQILISRAHLCYLQGRMTERDSDLASLDALAAATGDAGLRLDLLQERVRYLNVDGHYQQAITTAQEGLALATELDDRTALSRLLAQIGFAHYSLGQPRPALAALEAALSAAGERADAAMRGRISHNLGYVHFHLGDYARSLACQQEAYACHQQVGDSIRLASDGLDIGALLLEMGQVAEARRYLEEHLGLARRVGARPAEAYGLTLLGCWSLHQGDYAAAADWFRQAFARQSELQSEPGCVAAKEGLGLSLYQLGDLAEARRWLSGAAAQARAIGHRRRLVEVLVGLGLVETAARQPALAGEYLQEAEALARQSECHEGLATALAALARAGRVAGRLDAARVHAQQAVHVAQASDLPACEVWGRLEAGLVWLAQGEEAAALQETEPAVALLPRSHQAWVGEEQVHHAHACALHGVGQIEAADQHLRLAEACLTRKAERIADPDRRQRYLTFTRSFLFNSSLT